MTLPDEIKEFVLGTVLAVAIGLSSLVFFFYGPAIDAWWRQNWWIVALVAVAIIFFVVRRVFIRISARRKKGKCVVNGDITTENGCDIVP